MSLAPEPTLNVPEHTAEVARAAFPRGNRYMQMRDVLGTMYRNDQFADLYPNVGQPAEAPWRLALVQSCSETSSVFYHQAYRVAVWQSRHNILALRQFW